MLFNYGIFLPRSFCYAGAAGPFLPRSFCTKALQVLFSRGLFVRRRRWSLPLPQNGVPAEVNFFAITVTIMTAPGVVLWYTPMERHRPKGPNKETRTLYN